MLFLQTHRHHVDGPTAEKYDEVTEELCKLHNEDTRSAHQDAGADQYETNSSREEPMESRIASVEEDQETDQESTATRSSDEENFNSTSSSSEIYSQEEDTFPDSCEDSHASDTSENMEY